MTWMARCSTETLREPEWISMADPAVLAPLWEWSELVEDLNSIFRFLFLENPTAEKIKPNGDVDLTSNDLYTEICNFLPRNFRDPSV